MDFIFELLFAFLVELLPQLFVELLAEFGIRSISSVFTNQKPVNKYFSFFGYVILAALLGYISIAIKPTPFLKNQSLQMVNLIVGPILIGIIMSLKGKMLTRSNKSPIRLDSFIYGFSFALTYSLTRYLCFKP